MGKLILVRHGETDLNVKNIYFGNLNPPLNEKGKAQAQKTKKIIEKIEYEKIYSSDLERAKETAEIINIKNKKIIFSANLRELNFGIFEGHSYEELKNKFPNEIKKSEKNWKTYNYETGESVEELQKRVIKFVEENISFDEDTILVAHWGVINVILSYYLSNELDGYWKFNLKNGGVAILEFLDGFPILKGFNIGE